MLVGMKIVATSERHLVLADGTLEQFGEGSGTPVEYRTLSEAHRGDGCAAASDSGEGRVGFLISESKYFLIQAMIDRDDRLARYAMAVLRHMVEGGH
jgi:hypothetical protein